MKRYLIAGIAALLIPAAALAGTVYTRAWCKAPSHGRNINGGFGWISEVFIGDSSDECWRFANGHRQQGHDSGCSYVNPNTGETR